MGTLTIRAITRRYEGRAAIQRVSLEVAESEFLVIVGPSGCGKSTLLRAIAGFETPDEGEILLDGRLLNDVPPGDRDIAMVFQNYALYPHMSAAENIVFCLKNLKIPRPEIEDRLRNVAQMLRIEALLNRKPHQMSGGQRQRVAIGRAIIRNPKLYLFDEPFSNLDAALRMQMRVEIARLHQRFPTKTVYVTHDQIEAMTLASRIAVLNAGRLEQIGSPLELYHRPQNAFVAGFLGSPPMNFIPAEIIGTHDGGTLVQLFDGSVWSAHVDTKEYRGPKEVTVGIRPEHLKISSHGKGTPLDVEVVERLGNRTLLYGSMRKRAKDEHRIIIELPASAAADSIQANDTVRIGANPEDIFLFDAGNAALPKLPPLPKARGAAW